MQKQTLIAVLWVGALLIAASTMDDIRAAEMKVVSPNSTEMSEGSDTSRGGGQGKFQLLFPASDFASLPETHHTIVGLAWRPDQANELSDPVTGPAMFRLSTTDVDSLSTTFADNYGDDETVVFDGTITWQAGNQPQTGPHDFDYAVRFHTPFTYNPDQGNLLLEFTAPADWDHVGDWRLDTHRTNTNNIIVVSSTDPSSEFASGGLAGGTVPTQFTFTTPPLRAGDANQDLKFDQLDLVQVQIAAKYLTGQAATWGEGDWDGAPGGAVGEPPPGDGLFDQMDIIAALGANTYLSGPYGALSSNGAAGDNQTSVAYSATTGELRIDAPAQAELTSVNIDSAAGVFTGDAAMNLGGSFDNDADINIFKATFGSSFGSLSFGQVAQPGLDEAFLLADLSVVGSLAGGGALGDVDLIFVPVPEPATVALLLIGAVAACGRAVAIGRLEYRRPCVVKE